MHKTGVLAAAMLLAGCAASDQGRMQAGMPNPASAYCIQLGGSLAMENRAGGQVGICTLPDGTEIEEWELYRRDNG